MAMPRTRGDIQTFVLSFYLCTMRFEEKNHHKLQNKDFFQAWLLIWELAPKPAGVPKLCLPPLLGLLPYPDPWNCLCLGFRLLNGADTVLHTVYHATPISISIWCSTLCGTLLYFTVLCPLLREQGPGIWAPYKSNRTSIVITEYTVCSARSSVKIVHFSQQFVLCSFLCFCAEYCVEC